MQKNKLIQGFSGILFFHVTEIRAEKLTYIKQHAYGIIYRIEINRIIGCLKQNKFT